MQLVAEDFPQKFSKSNNFLVKLVLHFCKTNLSLRVISYFGMASLLLSCCKGTGATWNRRGGEKNHPEVGIRVYFWKAGDRLRSTSSSTVGPKPVVLSPQPCLLSASVQSRTPVLSTSSCPEAQVGQEGGLTHRSQSQALRENVAGNKLKRGKVYKPPTPWTVSSVNCFPR